MKKLIYRYLNETYNWDDGRVWVKLNDRIISVCSMSEDLSKVFGLTRKETKWYLKGWHKKTNKSFLFNRAWDGGWKNTVYVEAGVRRLKTTWNVDMAYDLNCYHGIDVEAELTRMLSEEINRQIVEGILRQYEEI